MSNSQHLQELELEIDRLHESSEHARRLDELSRQREEEARIPAQEFRKACLAFSYWQTDLQNELKRSPTSEEYAERLACLADNLRDRIQSSGFTDFYSLIDADAPSEEEQYRGAAKLLRRLLELPKVDAPRAFLKVFTRVTPVSSQIKNFLIPHLAEVWPNDYLQIRALPHPLTLDSLRYKFTPQGRAFLFSTRPILAEVVAQMRKTEAHFELYPDGVRHLIADLLFDGAPDPQRAKALTMEQLLTHLQTGGNSRLVEIADLENRAAKAREMEDGPAKDTVVAELHERVEKLLSLHGSHEPEIPAAPTSEPATAANVGTTSEGAKPPACPFIPLSGWGEILAALNDQIGEKHFKRGDAARDLIRKLNEDRNGPIMLPKGKGRRPSVDKSALVKWWVSLGQHVEARTEEKAAEEKSKRETLADTHSYGAAGTVVPGIGGSVKARRTTGKKGE